MFLWALKVIKNEGIEKKNYVNIYYNLSRSLFANI